MNEKIKELALQAGMVHPVMGEIKYTRFCYDKFAELIINECQDVIAEVYREMPLEMCGWMLHLDEKILERFYGTNLDCNEKNGILVRGRPLSNL